MLDKCYCGPMGKYSGHRLYELSAARGLPVVNQPEQDFAQDLQPLTLFCFLKWPPPFAPSPCVHLMFNIATVGCMISVGSA